LVPLAVLSRVLSPPSRVQSRVLSPRLLSRSRLTSVTRLLVLSLVSRLWPVYDGLLVRVSSSVSSKVSSSSSSETRTSDGASSSRLAASSGVADTTGVDMAIRPKAVRPATPSRVVGRIFLIVVPLVGGRFGPVHDKSAAAA
jgi:hypothetical protein